MRRWLEIRSYQLAPGMRTRFDRLLREVSVPMLRRWRTDVVAFGPSAHDEVGYVLMRAYDSPADRLQRQDAFYASAEWREGPRTELLGMIEAHLSVLVELDAAAIDGLRGVERER